VTTGQRRVSFGIKTSQMGLTYEEILNVWREAEQIPIFEHAWLWDHMVPLRGDIRGAALEAWTLLAALAAQTNRLRLGVMVTSNRLRYPTLLAKMAATVDIISGGRLDFGIGVGASRVAGENPGVREFEAYGVPLVSPGVAVRDLAESVSIVRRMWTEVEPFDFDGQSIQLKGTVCEPKPLQKPHPPILIGGAGDNVLRIVAEHADFWNYPGGPSPEFRQRNDLLNEHCAAIGRDPNEIVRSMQTIVRSDDRGTLSATRSLLVEMISSGVTHIVLASVVSGRPTQWIADEIIEPALAEVSGGPT
jgi:alkanesulfonate monooxygenase SsuD/methylene tetrahydromethanopterin reductase-like flavin-dependent oxidoreductase (luciferase family)